MGLNIKNPDTEAAIRRLALREGIGLTEAVDRAVRMLLGDEAEQRRREIERRKKAIDEIVQDVAAKLGPNPPTFAELEDGMYDEYGLPA